MALEIVDLPMKHGDFRHVTVITLEAKRWVKKTSETEHPHLEGLHVQLIQTLHPHLDGTTMAMATAGDPSPGSRLKVPIHRRILEQVTKVTKCWVAPRVKMSMARSKQMEMCPNISMPLIKSLGILNHFL